MLDTNLKSTYNMSRLVIPDMKKQANGHIINICSIASVIPYANGGSYSISKYAQYGLTKVLREELKPFNIGVTAILPGATLTSSWSGTDLPKERFVDPKHVAALVFQCTIMSQISVVEELIVRPMAGDIT
jgi:short-subunit dehydrogenase